MPTKEANVDAVRNWRKRLKLRVVQSFGGKCNSCGYSGCINALELHHLDPTKKEIELARGRCRAWLAIVEECKKCILLCANCHREAHSGLLLNLELKVDFDPSRVDEMQFPDSSIATRETLRKKRLESALVWIQKFSGSDNEMVSGLRKELGLSIRDVIKITKFTESKVKHIIYG